MLQKKQSKILLTYRNKQGIEKKYNTIPAKHNKQIVINHALAQLSRSLTTVCGIRTANASDSCMVLPITFNKVDLAHLI